MKLFNEIFKPPIMHPHKTKSGRYKYDLTKTMYEDELPEMTKEEYSEWFEYSWVDMVRIGPLVEIIS